MILNKERNMLNVYRITGEEIDWIEKRVAISECQMG
jgi:hypothetical protein